MQICVHLERTDIHPPKCAQMDIRGNSVKPSTHVHICSYVHVLLAPVPSWPQVLVITFLRDSFLDMIVVDS